MSGRQGAATSVVEDYVKVIYSHTEWQTDPITRSELAVRLGLAASTVTEMVKKLAALGLADHVPYGAVTLTEEGRALALRMLRRHRLIETWLVESFGYRWDEVHDDAEVLEHAVSDRLLEAISESLGDPVRDPHGDPIPAPDGTVVRPVGILLERAPIPFIGAVVRISDRDPALLQFLDGRGIRLDIVVEVVERRPFGGALVVRVAGVKSDLGAEAASSIWLSA
ncbi:DtxR family Mn-dependent transcriptional regulator [Cryobacterium mesophilum]|uniref:Manganese transport regulator n=1 Tax=Terrimesophilobacter mesophilus TaxID=433647 RepID=A0A4R8VCY4_9MICO|nr:metal-dependent transcriptional regulator [Terrimesophilobacter mesophilus]MBB5633902.1 DtxR family Mn-dependent transcriptional regulator [Terrimesophilobacter mesophilus]TFB80575.1 metal-dependent transcriptional regulator [Terrimesophilobacter mesophilus]